MSADNTARHPDHEEVTEIQVAGVQENLPAIPEKPAVPVAVHNRYGTASSLQISERESSVLNATVDPATECEVRPDGLVFMSQVHYRRRLNKAFGPGQWALMPVSEWRKDGNHLYREYALIVRGCFVAEAMGEAEYQPNNDNMTWGDATEAVKSDALKRCCKDLGVGSECWDRRFTEAFLRTHCVRVHRRGSKGKPKDKWEWRRKDDTPFWDEDGQESSIPQPQRKSEGQSAQKPPTAEELAELDRRAAAQETKAQDAAVDQEAGLDWSGDWRRGIVERIHEKSGTSQRGDWTRLGARINGEWVNTFDTKMAALLKKAHADAAPVYVKVEPEKDGKGYKALEVRS